MKISEMVDAINETKYWEALLTVEDEEGNNLHLTVFERTSKFIVLNFACTYPTANFVNIFAFPFEGTNRIAQPAWRELQEVLAIIAKFVNTKPRERI